MDSYAIQHLVRVHNISKIGINYIFYILKPFSHSISFNFCLREREGGTLHEQVIDRFQ